MTLQTVRAFLLWCSIINMGMLMLWFLMFSLAHDWIHRMHSKWFALSREKFDATHYLAMALFKTAVLMFNIVPYIALLIVGS